MKLLTIIPLIIASAHFLMAQTGENQIPPDYRADEQKPTLVMFTASWCNPCNYAKNVIFKDKDVSARLEEFNLLIFDVDTPTGRKYFSSYVSVKSGIPTFLLMDKDMTVVQKKTGVSSKPADFIKFLNQLL